MTVSFTGHRDACSKELRRVLRQELEDLIIQGTDTFCAGGAAGFDTLAAETVIGLREEYPWIMLRLVLPCPPEEQTGRFTEDLRRQYYDILRAADLTETVSPHYDPECMKRRNQRLIDLADVCVCFYDRRRYASGTGQTVRMAEKRGIDIINIFTK